MEPAIAKRRLATVEPARNLSTSLFSLVPERKKSIHGGTCRKSITGLFTGWNLERRCPSERLVVVVLFLFLLFCSSFCFVKACGNLLGLYI